MSESSATVIGLGLIGGSIAKGLSAAGWLVAGVDPDEHARATAAADGIAACASPAQIEHAPQLVIVAVPPSQTADCVHDALLRWPSAVLTDVASVKRAAIPEGAPLARFLPGHPLAGSESGGYGSSAPEMFLGATWALCPTSASPPALAADVGALLDALGAVALVCTPDAHDRAVARTSHLPHLLAAALADVGLVPPTGMAAALSGGALRDGTRTAGADIALWWSILAANGDQLADAIAELELTLAALRDAVASGDRAAAVAIWDRAQRARAQFMSARWGEREFEEIAIPLGDGWGPWLALGEQGRVLRHIRLDYEMLRAEVSIATPTG
jgi:prephenate dehydrogenase